ENLEVRFTQADLSGYHHRVEVIGQPPDGTGVVGIGAQGVGQEAGPDACSSDPPHEVKQQRLGSKVPPHPLDQPLAVNTKPSANRKLELALPDHAPFHVPEETVPLRILGEEIQDGSRRQVLLKTERPVRLEEIAGKDPHEVEQ